MTTHDALKRRIRVWLAQHGRTQAWLAAKLGISESLMSLILNGRRVPDVETAKALYQITGVKLPDTADRAALAS